MLMAMLIPRFVERRQEEEVATVLSRVGGGLGVGLRRGGSLGGGGASPAEAAATVSWEEDGVEESKGRGMGFARERRESADVKQAQQAFAASVPLPGAHAQHEPPLLGHLRRWQSQNIINRDGSLSGGEVCVEEVERGMARAMSLTQEKMRQLGVEEGMVRAMSLGQEKGRVMRQQLGVEEGMAKAKSLTRLGAEVSQEKGRVMREQPGVEVEKGMAKAMSLTQEKMRQQLGVEEVEEGMAKAKSLTRLGAEVSQEKGRVMRQLKEQLLAKQQSEGRMRTAGL